jgi:hypothetical protein
MRLAIAHEESLGAVVLDVSTKERALRAGLVEYPGFDLLSRRPGGEERAIEVKGRAGMGDIDISENEWAKACNLREQYWLYVVFGCASSQPHLIKVNDPWIKFIAKSRGLVLDELEIIYMADER